MTKTEKIFTGILTTELVLTIIAYFIPDTCGSACAQPGFLNPLGMTSQEIMCTMQCVKYQPGTIFYTLADLFILTFIGFGLSRISMNTFLRGVIITTCGVIGGIIFHTIIWTLLIERFCTIFCFEWVENIPVEGQTFVMWMVRYTPALIGFILGTLVGVKVFKKKN